MAILYLPGILIFQEIYIKYLRQYWCQHSLSRPEPWPHNHISTGAPSVQAPGEQGPWQCPPRPHCPRPRAGCRSTGQACQPHHRGEWSWGRGCRHRRCSHCRVSPDMGHSLSQPCSCRSDSAAGWGSWPRWSPWAGCLGWQKFLGWEFWCHCSTGELALDENIDNYARCFVVELLSKYFLTSNMRGVLEKHSSVRGWSPGQRRYW